MVRILNMQMRSADVRPIRRMDILPVVGEFLLRLRLNIWLICPATIRFRNYLMEIIMLHLAGIIHQVVAILVHLAELIRQSAVFTMSGIGVKKK